ncbi:MAG: hypothetical protein DMF63_02460 [Acidobacteria bacterium]|nr:MAG: hypothetical protein DMF63_02460 [Acidobacteriota bacterium]
MTATETDFSTEGLSLSEVLRIQQDNLTNDLREFANSGNYAGLLKTQQLLAEYPLKIRTAKLHELRQELDALPEQFEELKADHAKLIELRKEPAERLAKLADEIKIVGNEVARFEFSLGLVENDRKILESRRRDLRAEIARTMNEVNKELEITDEKFIN